MKRVERVSETEVIAEFLRNEFYQSDFHRDRDKFERIVLNPDFTDELENAVRRALLFRRRGHMWRELPADTEWWRIQLEPQDVERIRVFPRAHWRKIGDGNFQLTEIARRIRGNHFNGSVRDFVSKIQALSYRLRQENDNSAVQLIGVDENYPLTILEGNHRVCAALLASPEHLCRQFRVLVGFSPHMRNSCWYETNWQTLWHYLKNRVRNFDNREADVALARALVSARAPAVVASAPDVSAESAAFESKQAS